MQKILITGGCGFLGTNLAAHILLKRNVELTLLDNFYKDTGRSNLQWLKSQGEFRFTETDIRDLPALETAVRETRPDVIFHLAAQVAMTTSISDPALDFGVNALGTFNLVEAVRKHCPGSILIYSSTNKVYGDLEWVQYGETPLRYTLPGYPNGFPETIPLNFRSPYGCTKGYADQYLLDASRVFGIRSVVFRHSSMFGPRQFSTYDQGWIGWFCHKAIEIKKGKLREPFTISGNGKQVRDVLFADDMADLYMKAVENIEQCSGEAFNIGGGMPNSLSLLELFRMLEELLGIKMSFTELPPRLSDQKVFVADLAKTRLRTGWEPRTGKHEGVRKMISWISEHA